MPFSPSGGIRGPVQPFQFATVQAPPRTLAKSTTLLLTAAQAERNFAIPVGKGAPLRAGQIFRFIAGGILSTGNVQGTLMLTPYYGTSTNGLQLGPSAEQAYAAGLVNVPWRLKAELALQSVSLENNSSTVWFTGDFSTSGDPTSQGSGMKIMFGSTGPVVIDSKGPASNISGALNIAATFAANQVTASISAQYAFVRSS